jgi:hypothetical protein
MELDLRHSEGSPELRSSVFRLRNLGDVPVYFPLWERRSAYRVPMLHLNAYEIYTRNSNVSSWMQILTMGSTQAWGGVLIVAPGASADLRIELERILLDKDIPGAMFMLELSTIATGCEVRSPAINVRDLAELLPAGQ